MPPDNIILHTKSGFLLSNVIYFYQGDEDESENQTDLATVKNKLETEQYTDPWEFCDKVWSELEPTSQDNNATRMNKLKVRRFFSMKAAAYHVKAVLRLPMLMASH